jgi:type II secretory pathway pseudopilin PulG
MMQNNIAKDLAFRNVRRFNFKRVLGVGSIELLLSLTLVGMLAGLALPQYQDATEERRLANGAERIVSFVNTVRSESIKRNKPIAVSYTAQDDGRWCLGAVQGNKPCDCMQSDVTEPGFCAIESSAWLLSDGSVQLDNLISSVSGDGSFTIDPVRGIFVDFTDTLTLGLQSGEGQFQMSLRLIATGKPSLCLSEGSQKIAGYKTCAH